MDNFEETHKLIIEYQGKILKEGVNNLEAIIDYRDDQGKTYQTKKQFNIKLNNITLWQKIKIYFNRASYYLTNKLK